MWILSVPRTGRSCGPHRTRAPSPLCPAFLHPPLCPAFLYPCFLSSFWNLSAQTQGISATVVCPFRYPKSLLTRRKGKRRVTWGQFPSPVGLSVGMWGEWGFFSVIMSYSFLISCNKQMEILGLERSKGREGGEKEWDGGRKKR